MDGVSFGKKCFFMDTLGRMKQDTPAQNEVIKGKV